MNTGKYFPLAIKIGQKYVSSTGFLLIVGNFFQYSLGFRSKKKKQKNKKTDICFCERSNAFWNVHSIMCVAKLLLSRTMNNNFMSDSFKKF